MGQVERYGLYSLCLLIFLILGVAIWGDGAQPKSELDHATQSKAALRKDEGILSNEEKLRRAELEKEANDYGSLGKIAQPPEKQLGSENPPAVTPEIGRALQATHKIQRNETLESISLKHLGKRSRWREIAKLNPKVNPNRLKIGAEIVLPSASAKKAPASKKKSRGSKPAVVKGRTYRVKHGESPWSIAKSHYGANVASAYSKKIMKLNKIKRASDLKAGTVIVLPATAGAPAK